MIEKLEYEIRLSEEHDIPDEFPPNNRVITDKINEIIDFLATLEEFK